jgi:hypothetical protein
MSDRKDSFTACAEFLELPLSCIGQPATVDFFPNGEGGLSFTINLPGMSSIDFNVTSSAKKENGRYWMKGELAVYPEVRVDR